MDYQTFRDRASTGDVLLLEGSDLAGRFVRVLTGQQISHVALLLWLDDGLWVAEMRNSGYSLMPASQRVPDMAAGAQVYWGKAPMQVRLRSREITDKALSFRGSRYSWWSLITVWAAQIFRRQMPGRLVCSTLVERAWASGAYMFSQTPDPGDFMRLCESTTPLTIREVV